MGPIRILVLCLSLAALAWAAAGAASQTTPGSPAIAWAELSAVRDSIAADVEAGRLDAIHPKSERLAPLAKAVLDSSTALAPGKRARVETAVKQMPKVASALHEAADGGNAEATRRQLQRLDGLLQLMQGQYPADALVPPAVAPPHHGPGMHAPDPAGEHSSGHAHGSRPLAAVEEAPAATVVVRAGEFAFEPRTLELRAGVPTRIELRNAGAVEHSLVVRTPDGAADWIHLHAPAHGSDAATFRATDSGSYPLLCTIPGHTEAGMVGTLVVVR
jgi:uncharacterized cupredoxin-like copper-binding protein